MGDLFNTLLIHPIINLLLLFYYVCTNLGLPGAFGLAIVMLTLFIRILSNPLYKKQMHLAKQMQDLKPELDKLNEKYKNDKQRLQQEQIKLYQEKGINPAGGCIVAIVQIPVVIGLYRVLLMFLENGALDKAASKVNQFVYADFLKITHIDPWFFGFSLGVPPSHFKTVGFHYLIIPVITGLLQYVQFDLQAPKPAPKPVETDKNAKGKDSKDKKKDEPDMQTAMSTQMRYLLPFMVGYFSYILPVGLALYWNVYSLFTIYQYNNKLPWKKNKS